MVFFIFLTQVLLGALISAVRGIFGTKSSVPVLISTIYQHHEVHLHTLEIPHYVSTNDAAMSRNECHQHFTFFDDVNQNVKKRLVKKKEMKNLAFRTNLLRHSK